MRVVMKYGRNGLTLESPDDLDVAMIHKRVMPVLKDPEATLKSALANPSAEIFNGRGEELRSACILL